MSKERRRRARHGGTRMTELAQLRDHLRRLRDQAAGEKGELLAYRIGLALAEAEMELARRQEEAGRSIH